MGRMGRFDCKGLKDFQQQLGKLQNPDAGAIFQLLFIFSELPGKFGSHKDVPLP